MAPDVLNDRFRDKLSFHFHAITSFLWLILTMPNFPFCNSSKVSNFNFICLKIDFPNNYQSPLFDKKRERVRKGKRRKELAKSEIINKRQRERLYGAIQIISNSFRVRKTGGFDKVSHDIFSLSKSVFNDFGSIQSFLRTTFGFQSTFFHYFIFILHFKSNNSDVRK